MPPNSVTKIGLAAAICLLPLQANSDPVKRWHTSSRINAGAIENTVSNAVAAPLNQSNTHSPRASSSRRARGLVPARRVTSNNTDLNDARADASFPQRPYAIRSLSVVTSPDIGITSLTLGELTQIFAGDIHNWHQLGGADLAITPIQAAIGTDLNTDVHSLVLRPAHKPVSQTVFSMADAPAILTGLSTFAGGISLVPTDMVRGANTLGITDRCGITHQATDFATQTGDYPLSLLTLRHANSDPAKTTLISRPQNPQNWRIASALDTALPTSQQQSANALMKFLTNARQLSAVFTDGDLSQSERSWTRAHFIRLRDAIHSGALDGQDIHFLGFATNATDTNTRSNTRHAANVVLAAFKAFAPNAALRPDVSLTASGYGYLGDVGCPQNGANATRVEVWTRPAGS